MKKKGFRPGREKEVLIQEMIDKGVITKQEWNRIEEQREFDNLNSSNPGSTSWRVALECDQVRRMKNKYKAAIENAVADIMNAKATAQRLKIQIKKGEIKKELKPGMPMTLAEAEYEAYKNDNLAWAISRDILPELGKIRGLVGTTDLLKNPIITEEEFDEYVQKIEAKLRTTGIQLFELENKS
jgi:hypothetical protein